MKSLKKIMLSGLVLSLTGLTIVGCGPKKDSEKKTTGETEKVSSIKLWVPTGAKESYKDIISKYEADTKVKVEVIESEDPKAQEKIKKDPKAAADVFSLPHDQLGQLVESGVTAEIPEDFAKEITANSTEQAVNGAKYKGKLYAFPFGIESQVLMYNKTKLNEDDVKTYEKITEKATFGATFKQMNAYATGPLFMSVGNTLFGKNGEDPKGTNWGNEAGVAVLKWVAAQNNNKGFVNLDASNVMSKLADGSVAAIQSGPWDYQKAQEAVGANNLGVAVYPTINIGGKDVQQKAFLGVKLYAINNAPANGNPARIAASLKLAKYLTSKDSQINQFKTRNIVPSNKEVQSSSEVTNNELAKAIIAMGSSNKYTVVMPKLAQMGIFWEQAAAILSDVYNGKIPESQYLEKLKQFDKDIAAVK